MGRAVYRSVCAVAQA